ncbi:MAG: transcription antitermination factor NusB [Verrucomicrobia bacterium]|nr:transcription antitermination factor NusB [Verrucomicrobiota bacterium]
MTLAAEKLREIVFQLLYVQDFDQDAAEDIIPLLMREHAVTKKTLYIAKEQAMAIWGKVAELDPLITSAAIDYPFERIPRIERNILRLGLFELLHKDLPPKVALSESVRLARKFATPEAAQFVNAVLDALWKKSCESKKEEALKN